MGPARWQQAGFCCCSACYACSCFCYCAPLLRPRLLPLLLVRAHLKKVFTLVATSAAV